MDRHGRAALHGLPCPRLEPALDRLFGLLLELSNLLQSAHRFSAGRRLLLRVSDESDVNARAFLDIGQSAYVVEFTLGLIVWLGEVSATIATHISRDSEPDVRPRSLLAESAEGDHPCFQARLDCVSAELPEEHHGFWESLMQKFCVSVFAHEATHVIRGHIDLLHERRVARGELSELALRRRSAAVPTDVVRLLECDADSYSARVITHLALNPPEFLSRWRIGNARDTMIDALLGLTLFHVALERQDVDIGARSPEYPRPLLRLIVMLSEMDRVWAARHPGDDFFEETFTAALSVLKNFESVYGDIDLLRELLDQDRLEELVREANEITSAVQTFETTIVTHAFDGPGLWPAGSYD